MFNEHAWKGFLLYMIAGKKTLTNTTAFTSTCNHHFALENLCHCLTVHGNKSVSQLVCNSSSQTLAIALCLWMKEVLGQDKFTSLFDSVVFLLLCYHAEWSCKSLMNNSLPCRCISSSCSHWEAVVLLMWIQAFSLLRCWHVSCLCRIHKTL